MTRFVLLVGLLLGVIVGLLSAGCEGNAATVTPVARPCASDELWAKVGPYDSWMCARVCANQFHCWSGCCLPYGDAGANVCRDEALCYGAK